MFLRVVLLNLIIALFGVININASIISNLNVIKSDTKSFEFTYSPHIDGFIDYNFADGRLITIPNIDNTFLRELKDGSGFELIYSQKITVPSPIGFKLSHVFSNDKSDNLPVSVNYSGIGRYRHIASIDIIVAKLSSNGQIVHFNDKIEAGILFEANNDRVANILDKDDIATTINHNVTKAWRTLPAIDSKFEKKNSKSTVQSLSSGNWLRIPINEEGIYKIDAGTLSALGFSLTPNDIRSIKIFGHGGKMLSEKVTDGYSNNLKEQAIIMRTKSNGELDQILFYAAPANGFAYNGEEFRHYINHYTNTNYYLLTWGGDDGKRAMALQSPSEAPVNSPSTYTHRVFYEEEFYHAFPSPGSGRMWYAKGSFPWDATNILHNLDKSGTIFYRFAVAHRANSTKETSADGRFIIKENGNQIASYFLAGITSEYTGSIRSWGNANIPASKLVENRSVLNFSYSNPIGASAQAYLDFYEIHYPRSFNAISNEISFFTDTKLSGVTEYTINEFFGNEIIGFNITDKSDPKMLQNESVTGGMFIFKTKLDLNSPQQFYVSSTIKSASLEKIEFANLRDQVNTAEMILITHPDFLNSANKYKQYREKQSNLKVDIVRTDHIFNEFGYSIQDPTAIRDFLSHRFRNGNVKPKYVLLWGDGHFDFKNIQDNSKNFIPPYESIDDAGTLSALSSYTSDDYFTRVFGDDLIIDIAIGRVTVDSDQNGESYVEKLNHYENHSSNDDWRINVTLIADDSWVREKSPEGTLHSSQSERLSSDRIPSFIKQNKLYLSEYPIESVPGGRRKPQLTQNMLDKINLQGTLILNWIGHGNPRVWSHEEILDRDITVPNMTNLDKLFFVTAATCDYGRFDDPVKGSGAEEMIMSKRGAAIATFTATRVVISQRNDQINRFFYQNMFTFDTLTGNYPTLGEVMMKVKADFIADNDERFNLLGDPSLRLLIPNYQVRINKINGVLLDTLKDTLRLKGLSQVDVEGTIHWSNNPKHDDSFNGTAFISTHDGDEKIIAIDDYDGSQQIINKQGGALNQTAAKVVSGSFATSFLLPKDISYSTNTGRMFAYAVSNDNRFAKGANNSFIIDGIDVNPPEDNQAPTIQIYLDSRSFSDCGHVSPEPLLIVDLQDNTGINTTGRGIGHKIEAWFDDNPLSIDLTRSYKTSFENPLTGSAEQIIYNLKPGRHTVKVRAWDIYNNFATQEACFVISEFGDIRLTELISYPNPTEQGAVISFTHNLKPTFDAELQLFDMQGRLIRKMMKNIKDYRDGYFEWDGLDEAGNAVSTGIYIFNISAFTDKYGMNVATGKLSVVK